MLTLISWCRPHVPGAHTDGGELLKAKLCPISDTSSQTGEGLLFRLFRVYFVPITSQGGSHCCHCVFFAAYSLTFIYITRECHLYTPKTQSQSF